VGLRRITIPLNYDSSQEATGPLEIIVTGGKWVPASLTQREWNLVNENSSISTPGWPRCWATDGGGEGRCLTATVTGMDRVSYLYTGRKGDPKKKQNAYA